MMDVAQTAGTGSVGEYGWAGAAKTYYWVDPAEDLVGVFMTQYMTGSRCSPNATSGPSPTRRSSTDHATMAPSSRMTTKASSP